MNPFHALAQGNVLAVVMFALLLGIALVMGAIALSTCVPCCKRRWMSLC